VKLEGVAHEACANGRIEPFVSREQMRSTAGDPFKVVVADVVDKGPIIYVALNVPP